MLLLYANLMVYGAMYFSVLVCLHFSASPCARCADLLACEGECWLDIHCWLIPLHLKLLWLVSNRTRVNFSHESSIKLNWIIVKAYTGTKHRKIILQQCSPVQSNPANLVSYTRPTQLHVVITSTFKDPYWIDILFFIHNCIRCTVDTRIIKNSLMMKCK